MTVQLNSSTNKHLSHYPRSGIVNEVIRDNFNQHKKHKKNKKHEKNKEHKKPNKQFSSS